MQNDHDESARASLGPIPRPYTSGDDEPVVEKPIEYPRVPLDALPLSSYETAVQAQQRRWEQERSGD